MQYTKNPLSLLFVLTAVLFSSALKANDIIVQYISLYSPIAISEMKRTGIPASIKLAQGLLESDWGRSTMAVTANNHFGIKCGNNWDGATYFKQDDDYDTEGNLTESCFRAYEDPYESYVAHSDFLYNESKKSRYGFLFLLPSTDYKGWAQGLKEAGYATDPNYPQKLISLIEKYRLDQFDINVAKEEELKVIAANNAEKYKDAKPPSKPEVIVPPASADNIDNKESEIIVQTTATSPSEDKPQRTNSSRIKPKAIPTDESDVKITKRYAIQLKNNARYILAKKGETLERLTTVLGISEADLIAYNDQLLKPFTPLTYDQPIYIETKDRDYKGEEKIHIVADGESLEMIAQQYGIRATSLYAINKIPKSCQPNVGETVALQRNVDLPKKAAYSRKSRTAMLDSYTVIDK